MSTTETTDVRQMVRKAYGQVAVDAAGPGCCGSGCCAEGAAVVEDHPVPTSELGLSCGNPIAFSELKPGDTVVDLGSGAGKDAFLAAAIVGVTGHVIGVDMTPQMLALADANAAKFAASSALTNVEFREGYIEQLPVEDATVDAVISNCVVNLSPDKAQVFREAHRVLKPGGRLIVSDIVLERELPAEAKESAALYAACISGALLRSDYLGAIEAAGFQSIELLADHDYSATGACSDPVTSGIAGELEGCASSITVRAVKAG
jgi:arsenite methyltransferase